VQYNQPSFDPTVKPSVDFATALKKASANSNSVKALELRGAGPGGAGAQMRIRTESGSTIKPSTAPLGKSLQLSNENPLAGMGMLNGSLNGTLNGTLDFGAAPG